MPINAPSGGNVCKGGVVIRTVEVGCFAGGDQPVLYRFQRWGASRPSHQRAGKLDAVIDLFCGYVKHLLFNN